MEAIILDKNFASLDSIDYYTSFNWDKTLTGDGGCELYVPASDSVRALLKDAKYISRTDDDMVCQIQNVQYQTSPESGGTIVISGTDITKAFLNKRIVWNDIVFTGTINSFFKKILDENFGKSCQISERMILSPLDGEPFITYVDMSTSFIGVDGINVQTSHESVGDLLSNIAITYGYGIKLVYLAGHLYLRLIQGSNRSAYVVFSEDYDNLISTNYSNETANVANVMLVGGEIVDDETQRVEAIGEASGADREEKFVDASDLTSSIDWQSLVNMFYPMPVDGKIIVPPKTNDDLEEKGYIKEIKTDEGTNYYYYVTKFSIAVQDLNHFIKLKETYYMFKWSLETKDKTTFFTLYDAPIAKLPRNLIYDPPSCYTVVDEREVEITPDSVTNWDAVTYEEVTCAILPVLYSAMMMATGYEELLSYTGTTELSAEIESIGMFKYKTDYDLGDYIMVKDAFGNFASLMVETVSETSDSTGYHLDVKLNSRQSKTSNITAFLSTEDSRFLITEDGDYIIL